MKKASIPALAYLRVSGKAQAGSDKHGLPRQREAIQYFAKQNGYRIIEEFYDEGISGTLEQRPGLATAIARIASNGVRVVIIENSDRLARDLVVQEAIIAKLDTLGAKLITATGIDLSATDDPMKKAIRQILGVIAELDKSMIVAKLLKARQRKREEGKRVEGIRPFGTLRNESEALERIRTLHKERVSLARIAATLNAEGVPTRSQSIYAEKRTEKSRPPMPWTKQTVAKIIRRDQLQQSKRRPAKRR